MKPYLTLFLLLINLSSVSAFAESDVQENSLFLTPQERHQVQEDRRAYLGKTSVTQKKAKKWVKVIPAPPKIAVSGVIISPSGQKFVRVNEHFAPLTSPVVLFDQQKTQANTAVYQIKGKEVEIPVGSTYFSKKRTLVETYKVKREEQAKTLLKAPKQTASESAESVATKPASPHDLMTGILK